MKLERSVRYVEADPITFTAGGLSSGIDLALHIVAQYYGPAVAQKTADYMEYQGTGWKTNQGVSYAVTSSGSEDWAGELSSGQGIQLHIVHMSDGSWTATADGPGAGAKAMPATVKVSGNTANISFDSPGHPAVFTGMVNDAGDTLKGTYTQDGKSYPLTLTKKKDQME